jgi:DNA polymerase III delta prime subunit
MKELYPWQHELWQRWAGLRLRLPHAVLLKGSQGIGKLDFAVNLAQSMLCEAPLASGMACDGCRRHNRGAPRVRVVAPGPRGLRGMMDHDSAALSPAGVAIIDDIGAHVWTGPNAFADWSKALAESMRFDSQVLMEEKIAGRDQEVSAARSALVIAPLRGFFFGRSTPTKEMFEEFVEKRFCCHPERSEGPAVSLGRVKTKQVPQPPASRGLRNDNLGEFFNKLLGHPAPFASGSQ